MLDATARSAVAILQADGASIRTLEDDELVLRAFAGIRAGHLRRAHAFDRLADRGHRADARAGRSRMPAATRACARLTRSWLQRTGRISVSRSSARTAASSGSSPYGREPRRWRLEEEEALAALAATAATAYLNADLYQGVSHEQQRSEAILTNIADGIVAIDREGRVVLWNAAAERITGVPQRDAMGAPPSTPWVGRSRRIGSAPAERAS